MSTLCIYEVFTMKKKKTPINGDNKKRFQPHFRKAYNGKFTGHPQYIYADDEKMYKIIGITSSPKTNGVDNIPLECNPEPKNKKKAYVRPQPDKENKGAFGERLKGWKFTGNDKEKVRIIIETHDKKKK